MLFGGRLVCNSAVVIDIIANKMSQQQYLIFNIKENYHEKNNDCITDSNATNY